MRCKAVFSASWLYSLVSHDPSEIILIMLISAHKKILIIIHFENNCAASYFCGNHDTFFPVFTDE